MRSRKRGTAVSVLMAMGLAGSSIAADLPKAEVEGDAPGYEVSCADGATDAGACEVDKATYIGWRTYAANCQVCHGGSGLGSTFAPNLMDRLSDHVDYGRFIYVMENGYTGQVGAMPAWKANNQVFSKVPELYAYLKARTDEALPQGRPKRKK